jgi:hypothetical protein
VIVAFSSVRFTDAAKHDKFPNHYPAPGTVGTVVGFTTDKKTMYVQWEEGSTSASDIWACPAECLEELVDVERIAFELRNCIGHPCRERCMVCSRRHDSAIKDCWADLMADAAKVIGDRLLSPSRVGEAVYIE